MSDNNCGANCMSLEDREDVQVVKNRAVFLSGKMHSTDLCT